jgi:hypothetical protein
VLLVSNMLGKCSNTELHHQSQNLYLEHVKNSDYSITEQITQKMSKSLF